MPKNLVSSRTLLQVVLELERRGSDAVLEQLEHEEPELAEYLMETLSMIHGRILALGGPAKQSRCAYRRVESLTLTCVLSLRYQPPASDADGEPTTSTGT